MSFVCPEFAAESANFFKRCKREKIIDLPNGLGTIIKGDINQIMRTVDKKLISTNILLLQSFFCLKRPDITYDSGMVSILF